MNDVLRIRLPYKNACSDDCSVGDAVRIEASCEFVNRPAVMAAVRSSNVAGIDAAVTSGFELKNDCSKLVTPAAAETLTDHLFVSCLCPTAEKLCPNVLYSE